MKISLNTAERDALYGLPYAVICMYVMAIRPRMDYITGIVGARPRISWQALCEWLYVEPVPGVPKYQPSRWAVRRMAWHLERAGLLRLASIKKQLIFECVLASRDNSVSKQAATRPPRQAARSNPSAGAGFRDQAARPLNGQAATHPVSGLKAFLLPHVLAANVSDHANGNGALRAPSRKLNGAAHAAQSEKASRSKAAFQEENARPMPDEELDRLPRGMAAKIRRKRNGTG